MGRVARLMLTMMAAALAAGSAGAQMPMTVLNHSFEDPGWATDGDGRVTLSVPHWDANVLEGCFNPKDPAVNVAGFFGTTGVTNDIPAPGDGPCYGQLAGNWPDPPATWSQAVSDTFVAGNTYTLTVAVGKRSYNGSGLWNEGDLFIQLANSDRTVIYATVEATAASTTAGYFVDHSCSWTPDSDTTGVYIWLVKKVVTTHSSIVDNVRLTEEKGPPKGGVLIVK